MNKIIAMTLLAGIAIGGCKSSSSSSPTTRKSAGDDSDFEVPAVEMSEWPDAIRLSNGQVNLFVVPSIGRVMRFGYSDAPNVIWTNARLRPRRIGETIEESPATTQPVWKNWGGDKAWPWPQDQWPLHIGRAWPPPIEVDQMTMTNRLIGGLSVRLESKPVRGYGVKLVREIALDPADPVAVITTRWESASADLPPSELAAWQITQVPVAAGVRIYAKLAPVGAVVGLPPAPWEGRHAIAPGILVIDLPAERAGKIGLDAATLAWAAGEVLFVAHSETAEREARRYRTGERAQVYIQNAPNPKSPSTNTPSRYAEFEFTSPRRDLARGENPELRVTWRLFRIENGTWTDAEVAKVLSQFQ
jgi:hypothetical protein